MLQFSTYNLFVACLRFLCIERRLRCVDYASCRAFRALWKCIRIPRQATLSRAYQWRTPALVAPQRHQNFRSRVPYEPTMTLLVLSVQWDQDRKSHNVWRLFRSLILHFRLVTTALIVLNFQLCALNSVRPRTLWTVDHITFLVRLPLCQNRAYAYTEEKKSRVRVVC